MKLNAASPYLKHDHLLTDIARMYSNELKEAFFVAVGDFEGYDIFSNSQKYRIEVKVETTPIRTKNVAIEFWNTDFNKPSGVLATSATLWLHIVLEEKGCVAYEYDIDKLRKLCFEVGEVKSNGRNSLCKIIHLDEFKKHALRSFALELSYSLN